MPPNNRQSTCSAWQVPKSKVRPGPTTREISVNHEQNKASAPAKRNDQPRETIKAYNRFDLLSHTNENDGEFNINLTMTMVQRNLISR